MADKDYAIPKWMKELQLRTEGQLPDIEAELQRRIATARFIEANSPAFWKRLLDELEIAVAALPALKLEGRLRRGGALAEILLVRPGTGTDFTSVIVRNGFSTIDVQPGGAGWQSLAYLVTAGSDLVVTTGAAGTTPMDPAQTAQYILMLAIKRLLPKDAHGND